MKCKEYVFRLTSGQLDDATVDQRLQAKFHLVLCKYCRAYTRNNDKLSTVLTGYKDKLVKQDESDLDC